MSLKKNEKIKRKVIKRHLKQEEDALLSAYKKALTNIDKDITKYYKRYAIDDVLPKDRIRKARQLKGLRKNVDQQIVRLHASESSIIGSNLAETYKTSYYRGAHTLETQIGADLGFSMVSPKVVEAAVANKLGLVKWPDSSKANALSMTKKIKTSIEQGVIQGYSLQKTSRAVQRQLEIGASKSITILRTETGRVRTEGTLATYDEADAEGLPITRVWLTSLDARTRDTHAKMDKKEADKDNLFHLPSGVVTRGPHLSGVAAEDINCRCDVIAEIPTIDPSKFRAARDPVTGESVNVKNMEYDDWAYNKKIKNHETVRVMAPEDFPSKKRYTELHKGEKSKKGLQYDWIKLRRASGEELTEAQIRFHKRYYKRYEGTSVTPKGEILIKPLKIPKPKPVVPPVEVKFSEGVLKTDNFAVSEGWEARHEAHKAALKQRMGFDTQNMSMQSTKTGLFRQNADKFDKAVKSFTAPSSKTKLADTSLVKGVGPSAKFKKGIKKYSDTINDIGGDNVIAHYNRQRIKIKLHTKIRAHAQINKFTVNFDAHDFLTAQFHEYGHLLEQDNAVRVKAGQWLRKRGHGNTAPLNSISFYSDTDLAFVNKFIDPYVGKIYAHGITEALSTGMAQMTNTTAMMRFAKKDFDHFAFVHGILTGAI